MRKKAATPAHNRREHSFSRMLVISIAGPKNDQHEFTPEKQEDLNKWSDMMTVNVYPDVGDGERLAATANAVLENYKSHQARVLKTRSVPRTADRPAEHLIAVVFTRPVLIRLTRDRRPFVRSAGRNSGRSSSAYELSGIEVRSRAKDKKQMRDFIESPVCG
jgi:hypothetical protein